MSAWEKDIENILQELLESLISDRVPNKPEDWDLLMVDKFKYLLKKLGGEKTGLSIKGSYGSEMRDVMDTSLPAELKKSNVAGGCVVHGEVMYNGVCSLCEKERYKNPMSDFEKSHFKWTNSTCGCEHCKGFRKIQERGYIGVKKTELEKLFKSLDGQTLTFDIIIQVLEPFHKKYLPELK